MIRARVAMASLLLSLAGGGAAAEEAAGADGLRFEQGAAALRSLAGGSRVTLAAPDGSSVSFRIEDGALQPEDYAARTEEGSRAIRTPGGYRIGLEDSQGLRAPALAISAPSEMTSYLWFSRAGTTCAEDDGRIWQVGNDVILIFLPDGTRIDLDRPARVVQINAGGSAWRMNASGFAATEESSPALEAPYFLAVYQTGDGDDWSRMGDAALVATPWKDMPRALPLDELLAGLRGLPWKPWMEETLSRLPAETEPEETAGYLLASYFSMPPGSQVRFESKRGRNPRTIFILPGTMVIPREGVMRMEAVSPTVGFGR